MKALFIVDKKWIESINKLKKIQNIFELDIYTDLKSSDYYQGFYDFFVVDKSILTDANLSKIHRKIICENFFLVVEEGLEVGLEVGGENLGDKFIGYIDLRAKEISNISYLKTINENIKMKTEKFFIDKTQDYISVYDHKFIDRLDIGVLFQDKDGVILGTNTAAEKMLGMTKNQVTGTLSIDPRWTIIKEDGSILEIDEYPAMITLKTKVEVINTIIGVYPQNDDKVKWLRVNTIPFFKNGNIDIVYSYFEDITEIKENNDYIKLLALAVEYSPLSILITDSKGIIQSVNPMFEEITGYNKKEIIGENPRIFKHKDSTTNYKEMWNTIRSGLVWRGEFTNVKANGEKYSEETVIAPVRDKFNKITHYIALKEDVTDLKRTKRKLENTLKNLESLVDKRTESLRRAQKLTLESLAILAEYRDNETGAHIQRTKYYMKLILEELEHKVNYNSREIEQIWSSAPLHDIGKVAISDSVLLKPGKLTKEEFDIMKEHVNYGYQALIRAEDKEENVNNLKFAKEITLYHHEKWDGSGYPEGLSGKSIPLSARVMALADVYDALRSKRPYKEAFSHEKVVSIILSEAGKHFDPMIIKVFLDIHRKFDEIFNMYTE